jgi:hypothetical protein
VFHANQIEENYISLTYRPPKRPLECGIMGNKFIICNCILWKIKKKFFYCISKIGNCIFLIGYLFNDDKLQYG